MYTPEEQIRALVPEVIATYNLNQMTGAGSEIPPLKRPVDLSPVKDTDKQIIMAFPTDWTEEMRLSSYVVFSVSGETVTDGILYYQDRPGDAASRFAFCIQDGGMVVPLP